MIWIARVGACRRHIINYMAAPEGVALGGPEGGALGGVFVRISRRRKTRYGGLE
jgi:hypothetical protein